MFSVRAAPMAQLHSITNGQTTTKLDGISHTKAITKRCWTLPGIPPKSGSLLRWPKRINCSSGSFLVIRSENSIWHNSGSGPGNRCTRPSCCFYCFAKLFGTFLRKTSLSTPTIINFNVICSTTIKITLDILHL